MMKKLFWAVMLTAVLGINENLYAYSGGDGSSENPYYISNVNDFLQFSSSPQDWDKSFVLTTDIDLSGLTFTQSPIAPDIDNTEYNDFQGTPFTGEFIGWGHKISNLTIIASSQDYIGLFGYVEYGSIQCLCVENTNISGRNYVGGLVGFISGNLYYCISTGMVLGINNTAGGLVGRNNGYILECSSTSSVSGYWYVGGLVGENYFEIESCYATGSISCSPWNGAWHVGGLAGINLGSITFCYATGLIDCSSYFPYSSYYIGGLVGWNGNIIFSCYSTGSGSGSYAGGLVGINYCGTIKSCYSKGDNWEGGLVGWNDQGQVINCYSTGKPLSGFCFQADTGGNYEDTGNFWDTQTSEMATSAMGTGKTTSEMKTLSTFISSGWDFSDTDGDTADWWMPSNDYPQLAWTVNLTDSEPVSGPYQEPVWIPQDNLLEQWDGSSSTWSKTIATPPDDAIVFILNHGWNDGPDYKLKELAAAIFNKVPGCYIYTWRWGNGPNVISDANPNGLGSQDDISIAATCLTISASLNIISSPITLLCIEDLLEARVNAEIHGLREGRKLYDADIRPDRHKIHFIGHSLGGIVSNRAGIYLNYKTSCSVEQFTAIETPILEGLFIPTAPFKRVEGIYYPWWLNLLRTGVGGPLSNANFNLALSPAYYDDNEMFSNNLHTAAMDWYVESVNRMASDCGDALYGFGWSFSQSTELPLGNYVEQSSDEGGAKGCIVPFTEDVEQDVTRVIDKVADSFDSAMTWVGQSANIVADPTELTFNTAIRLNSQAIGGQVLNAMGDTVVQSDNSSTTSVSYIYKYMDIPLDATQITFDYRFLTAGDGDVLTLSMNDQLLTVIDADSAGVSPVYQQSTPVNINKYAGQNVLVQIALRLDGDGTSIALIDNLRLSKITLSADINGDLTVNVADLALLAQQWLGVPQELSADIAPDPVDGQVNLLDFAVMANYWLMDLSYRAALEITWADINNDPGVPDHEGFNGQMSKYETTNAQYCDFLNAACDSNDIIVDANDVRGSSGLNSGADFAGVLYYQLDGPGIDHDDAVSGGTARINFINGTFTVDPGFEDHPVTYVTWYGATAFCNYYGWRLPTEWEWQAVADFDRSYAYGCGPEINNTIANYDGSPHPEGTTIVGSLGDPDGYGYGMYDMAGNVWEWTSSLSSNSAIIRGGAWYFYGQDYCDVSFQGYNDMESPDPSVGFRVCSDN